MKKLMAIALLAAVLLTSASCSMSKKVYFDEDEYNKAVSESQVEESESLVQQAKDISEALIETENDLGKTEKNKQIVVKIANTTCTQYEKIVFKSGKPSYRLTYKFFDDTYKYNNIKELGDDGNDKLIEKDDQTRLLVYKSKSIMEVDYESYLNFYERKDKDQYTVIY